MTVTEKAAYLKGLVDGLKLNDNDDITKAVKAIVDVIDDLALTVADLEDEVIAMQDEIVEIDEDLAMVEEDLYEDDDEEIDADYVVECPECGAEIYLDEELLEDGGIACPECGVDLELEFDTEEE